MRTTLAPGPAVAADLHDGDAFVLANGWAVAVDSVATCSLGPDLLTIVGYVRGLGMRTFRLDEADPVMITGHPGVGGHC